MKKVDGKIPRGIWLDIEVLGKEQLDWVSKVEEEELNTQDTQGGGFSIKLAQWDSLLKLSPAAQGYHFFPLR